MESDFISEKVRLIIRCIILLIPLSTIFSVIFTNINGSMIFYCSAFFVLLYIFISFIRSPLIYIKDNIREILFIVVCFFSIIINQDKSSVYSYIRLIEVIIFILALMVNSRNCSKYGIKRETKIIFEIIVGITFLLALFSIVFQILHSMNIFTIETMQYYNNGIFGGLYRNSNQLGIYCFISLMLSLYLFIITKKKYFLMNSIVEIGLILVSGCRSVLLILGFLFIGAIYYNLSKNVKFIKLKRYLPYIIFVILISMILLIGWATLIKSKSYYSNQSIELFLDQLSGNRFTIWKESFVVFLSSPIFGVGLSNIQITAKHLLGDTSLMVIRNYENAHNIIVNLLTYTGIVGFLSFIFLCMKYVKGIKNNLKAKYELSSLILLCLAISLLLLDFLDIVIIFNNRLPTYIFFYIIGYLFVKPTIVLPKGKGN